MEIYVIQPGDDIESIAYKYGISIERLISDNGLINPYTLVVGQTLVILNPKNIYIVKQGDTLSSIAESYGISVMQLIRNNPFLYDREYLYPDEILVIDYHTVKDIQVNGYTNSFISQEVLARSLPYLTYISIYNYQITENGSSRIMSLGDDSNIIRMAKQYSTVPLLMISALSQTGNINVEYVYRLLLDELMQDSLMNELLEILRSKEFMGVNMLISYISYYNQGLYLKLFKKMSTLLRKDGYFFMITISPDYSVLENLDYQSISLYVDRIIFLQNIWTKKKQPPAPISNISLVRPFIENVVSKVSPNYISLGKPLVGCDWIVPYAPVSTANLMSLNSTIVLAYEQRAEIHLDEESQTPYFNYIKSTGGDVEEHKVWFIDAHSLNAADGVVIEFDLAGTGIWNITSYFQQLFSIISAYYNVIKLPIK